MHVYNAIIVLKEVLPVFPVAAASGTAGYSLVTVLDRLLEKEERGDLKILARAYHASLKKRESIWAIPTDHKSGHVPMRFDSPARTSTPTGPGLDSRSAGQSANPPSAPRSHVSSANNGIVAPVQPKANQSINSTKGTLESVPRPDYIKRVGRGDKMDTTPDYPSTPELNKSGTPQPTREPPTGPAKPAPPTQPRRSSPGHAADARRDFAYAKDQSRPPSPSGTSHSSTRDRGPDDRRESPQTAMPPPAIPSQKPSAQELRETAKMTMSSRLPDKPDMDRSSQHDQNGHPPRRRSMSPSRPGTRNPSLDSRGSAGQSRSAGEDERRDSRPGPSRRESARLERRDRLSGRDGRESDREDRERERERDRHGERERKERDRTERDKDRERERERERDRERERERERDRDRNGGRDSRDRHRRDERDRKERPAARESAREQRESGWESAREPTAATPAAPAETPTRPSDAPSRHRSATKGEDGLGKRRRPADDDVSKSPFHFGSLASRNSCKRPLA